MFFNKASHKAIEILLDNIEDSKINFQRQERDDDIVEICLNYHNIYLIADYNTTEDDIFSIGLFVDKKRLPVPRNKRLLLESLMYDRVTTRGFFFNKDNVKLFINFK